MKIVALSFLISISSLFSQNLKTLKTGDHSLLEVIRQSNEDPQYLFSDCISSFRSWITPTYLSRPYFVSLMTRKTLHPLIRKISRSDLQYYIKRSDPLWKSFTIPVSTLSAVTVISFYTEKGVISISLKTGEVTIPKGMKMTEASKEFWKCVQKNFPTK